MKQLRQQHSHSNNKVWTSVDCLLASPPISSTSLRIQMRSNLNLPITDTRRISPQTTVSSGYHSDLSSATSTNQSPQSVHEIVSIPIEKSPTSFTSSSSTASAGHSQKQSLTLTDNSTHEKTSNQKSLSRLSSFLRRQYERARLKLTSNNTGSSSASCNNSHGSHHQKATSIQPLIQTAVKTCSKATSTTPLSHLSDETPIPYSNKPPPPPPSHASYQSKPHYHPQYLSAVYKQSAYAEPVYSIFVHPKYNSNAHRNYASIHECYSQNSTQQRHHHAPLVYPPMKNPNLYSSSYRQPVISNSYYDPKSVSRHHYVPVESSNYEHYYAHRSRNLSKMIDTSRSTYAPLSDFVSTKTSAFKPIPSKRREFRMRPLVQQQIYEHVSVSDDPCDLEVAQYFPHTSQWSNPNYFDIYNTDLNVNKKHYNETLC